MCIVMVHILQDAVHYREVLRRRSLSGNSPPGLESQLRHSAAL